MKLQSYKINSFSSLFKSKRLCAALVYGENESLMRAIATQITKTVLPAALHTDDMARAEITLEQLKENHSLLAEEFSSISMFCEKKIILMRLVASDAEKHERLIEQSLNNAISNSVSENFILITVIGNLGAKSCFRNIMEGVDFPAVSIACYKEDKQALSAYIRQRLSSLPLTQEIKQHLMNQLAQLTEKTLINRELEKIEAFIFGGGVIATEQLEFLLSSEEDLAINELINAILLLDHTAILLACNRYWQVGGNATALLRIAYSNINQLRQIIASESPISEAITKIRPPIFFKQVAIFEMAASKWRNLEHIDKAMDEFLEMELTLKSQKQRIQEMSLVNFLLQLGGCK